MSKGACSPGGGGLTFHISDKLPGVAMPLVQGPYFKSGVETESWVFVEMSSSSQFKILS